MKRLIAALLLLFAAPLFAQSMMMPAGPGASASPDATKANLAGGNNFTGTQQVSGTVSIVNNRLFLNDVSAFVGFGGAGNASVFTTAAGGINLAGQGSSYDLSLLNQSGATALRIPFGTTNVEVVGSLSANTATTTGNLSATAGGKLIVTNAGNSEIDLRDTTGGGGVIKFRNTADSASLAILSTATGAPLTLQADTINLSDLAVANNFISATAAAVSVKAANATVANVTSTGVAVTGTVTATTAITSSGATSGTGYATGAGGAVTQLTSRTTGVTLNKMCGAVTLFSTTTTAGQVTTLTVTDSGVAATDVIIVDQKTGTGIYIPTVTAIGAGTFNLSVYTPAAVGSAEAPVMQFCAFKGANS